MTATTGTTHAEAAQPTRWIRWLLVAVHISVVSWPVAFTILSSEASSRHPDPVSPVLAGLAVLALQLWHSLAVAAGRRPRGGLWTFLALAVLAYLPMLWFGAENWLLASVMLVASAPMVFRGRTGLVVAAAIAVLMGTVNATVYAGLTPPVRTSYVMLEGINALGIVGTLGAALYGSARLVRVLDELHAARTELAELAVGRERLRISRDLHDLLGQSLSAIALKGDLAIRLLRSDTGAARGEIESLATVARDALRGVRAVARDEHMVSLPDELDGAAVLLSAAGISARIDADVAGLTPPAAQTFAWALREGVANVLRHSEARICSITAARQNGTLRLEIVNDGAGPPGGGGRGLAGLAERAHALSGTVTAGLTDTDRFRLLVTIPEEGGAP